MVKNQAMKKSQKSNISSTPLLDEIQSLRNEIKLIKIRNAEKDSDKAWETSLTRRILVALFTYFVMVLVMGSIGVSEPFMQAIIPTSGFLLSTFSLSLLRRLWK